MMDFKTKKDWCESFLTCFNSSELRRRCLEDFDFYDNFFLWSPGQQAFTFEIGTYLRATRIQVNYCQYPYLFGVNIIHCDSGGRYNGSGKYLIFGYDFLNRNLTLLRVVGQSLNPQTFEPTTPNIFSRSVVCWIRFYNSSDIVGTTHAHYTCLQSLMGCILFTMHRRSQYCLEFCVRFLTTANTDATTLNIVGPQC